jgi:RNA-directed DNA polymerase
LLAGEYRPQVCASKETKGGAQRLGIPSVVDRPIQQVLLLQLTTIFDLLFSDNNGR